MRHLSLLIACAAPLSGCILETELCGRGFVEREGGRCVPQEAPPPYYSDAGFDLGVDAAAEPEPRPEPVEPETAPPEPPPPEPEPAFDPWEGRETVLIVDRSNRDSARRTPASPGFDLDAIVIVNAFAGFVGVLANWEAAQINDPFGRNVSQDPAAALGENDAFGEGDPERHVSLGTEGGFVHFVLDLNEPIRAGFTLNVFESEADGDEEQAEIYLCFPGQLDLSLCRSAGTVRGTGRLTLR